MRESVKKTWLVKKPIASVTESLQVYVSVSAAIGEVTEVAEVLEVIETTEVIVEAETTEEVGTGEVVDVSMTDEEATANRAHLLRGFATTDTEALLHRAEEELTATSQAAHTETILPPAGAARLPTTALAAVPPPLHPGAAAATPRAFRHPTRHRLARPEDAATTGQHHETSPTAKTTAKAKASVVTKAADPVRVLLLTNVAHDHPDATASPTTPAAEGRPPTIADHLLPRNATAEHRRQYLVRHLASVAMLLCHDRPHDRLQGVARGAMTKSSCRAPTDTTNVGLAKVMQAGVVAVAAVAAVRSHHQKTAR
jgi:hypothetical protein